MNSERRCLDAPSTNEAGFSLVELMIAIAVVIGTGEAHTVREFLEGFYG